MNLFLGVEQCKVEESQLMLEAMNGFLLLLDRKKKILYVSDGVATHLGIDQVRWVIMQVGSSPSRLGHRKIDFELALMVQAVRNFQSDSSWCTSQFTSMLGFFQHYTESIFHID